MQRQLSIFIHLCIHNSALSVDTNFLVAWALRTAINHSKTNLEHQSSMMEFLRRGLQTFEAVDRRGVARARSLGINHAFHRHAVAVRRNDPQLFSMLWNVVMEMSHDVDDAGCTTGIRIDDSNIGLRVVKVIIFSAL